MSGTAIDPHAILDHKDLRNLIGEPAEVSARRFKFTESLTETQIEFIKRSPFCVLCTINSEGFPSVSPKGDAPGFVEVVSHDTLLIPDRPGNKLIFGLENILARPEIQILFLVPNTCETLRVSGRATLTKDPDLCKQCAAGGQDALLIIRVHITECYYHCAKAFVRSQLWKPDTWPRGRFNIKLGHIMARNAGKDESWVQEYEKGAAGRLRDVEDHYVKKVWQVSHVDSPALLVLGDPKKITLAIMFASSLAAAVIVAKFRLQRYGVSM